MEHSQTCVDALNIVLNKEVNDELNMLREENKRLTGILDRANEYVSEVHDKHRQLARFAYGMSFLDNCCPEEKKISEKYPKECEKLKGPLCGTYACHIIDVCEKFEYISKAIQYKDKFIDIQCPCFNFNSEVDVNEEHCPERDFYNEEQALQDDRLHRLNLNERTLRQYDRLKKGHLYREFKYIFKLED